jgi:hypothetical protein
VVEALLTAKKRVRHVLQANLRGEIQEMVDLAPGPLGSQAQQRRMVVAIHGEQQVETRKVVFSHLPRALARNVETASGGGGLGAVVRRLAHMPFAKPR